VVYVAIVVNIVRIIYNSFLVSNSPPPPPPGTADFLAPVPLCHCTGTLGLNISEFDHKVFRCRAAVPLQPSFLIVLRPYFVVWGLGFMVVCVSSPDMQGCFSFLFRAVLISLNCHSSSDEIICEVELNGQDHSCFVQIKNSSIYAMLRLRRLVKSSEIIMALVKTWNVVRVRPLKEFFHYFSFTSTLQNEASRSSEASVICKTSTCCDTQKNLQHSRTRRDRPYCYCYCKQKFRYWGKLMFEIRSSRACI
jgi:hypothetical protein